jgi:hypothetical protein
MTRRGACAPRYFVSRTPTLERLEARGLLSSSGVLTDGPSVGFAIEAPPIPIFVFKVSNPGVVSPLVDGPVPIPPVMVTVPAPTPIAETSFIASGTGSDAMGPSGGIELPAGPSPVLTQVNAPSLVYTSTASLTGAGVTTMTAEDTGRSSVGSAQSAGSVLVAAPAALSTQEYFVMNAAAGLTGPPGLAISLSGEGGLSLASGFTATTGTIGTPTAMAVNLGYFTIQALPATATLATSRALFLSALFTATPDGYLRFATNNVSSLGVVVSPSNSAAVVGISTVILAPSGTSKVAGEAGSLPAMDRSLALVGGGLAPMPPHRGISEPESPATFATTEDDPRRMAEETGLVLPSPQRSGLIMDFRPFDPAAVGQAIDRLLRRFEDLGAGLSWLQGPTDVVVDLLAAAVAMTAWKVVPRILGRSRDDEELAADDVATTLDGISGLPGVSTSNH